jgi:hypothetical protein
MRSLPRLSALNYPNTPYIFEDSNAACPIILINGLKTKFLPQPCSPVIISKMLVLIYGFYIRCAMYYCNNENRFSSPWHIVSLHNAQYLEVNISSLCG